MFMIVIFVVTFLKGSLSFGIKKPIPPNLPIPPNPLPRPGNISEIIYPNRPHIIILMADDLGLNDVSYRGSNQILTPNIDALAYQGVVLNRHYTPEMCTPSRAALLTGKNPVNIGMQHFVIEPCEPRGLPLHLKLLPQYLKQAGYSTHLVGKWHLGYARKAFIPTQRGFDTFFGCYNGHLDYYDHMMYGTNFSGYDFRRNENITYEGLGEYATNLFTEESTKIIQNHNVNVPLFLVTSYTAPHSSRIIDVTKGLQAPQEEIDSLSYIRDSEIRTHAAMVTLLDKGIGQIIKELSIKKMLSNCVILFFSDNGAPIRGIFESRGSNFPLRGQKISTWEGAVRVPAAFWSPLMEVRHGVSNRLIHNTDWLPTFVAMSGLRPIGKFDGYDMWPTLAKNLPSPRKEIIHNINPVIGYSSIYYKGWKYINGSTDEGLYDSWLSSKPQYHNPNATRYTEIVRSSDAWQALAPFALRTLGDKSIQKIRKNTKVYCQPKIPYAMGCNPLKGPCLFRIKEDPCELNNLAGVDPFRTYLMQVLLEKFRTTMVYPQNLPLDYETCDPRKFNGTFTWWLELEPENPDPINNTTPETTTEGIVTVTPPIIFQYYPHPPPHSHWYPHPSSYPWYYPHPPHEIPKPLNFHNQYNSYYQPANFKEFPAIGNTTGGIGSIFPTTLEQHRRVPLLNESMSDYSDSDEVDTSEEVSEEVTLEPTETTEDPDYLTIN